MNIAVPPARRGEGRRRAGDVEAIIADHRVALIRLGTESWRRDAQPNAPLDNLDRFLVHIRDHVRSRGVSCDVRCDDIEQHEAFALRENIDAMPTTLVYVDQKRIGDHVGYDVVRINEILNSVRLPRAQDVPASSDRDVSAQ